MPDESKPQFWDIDPERSKQHWLTLKDAEFEREECWPKWEFHLKWDGCCHLHLNMPDSRDGSGMVGDYWHLCGGVKAFDEMIARLQEAKAFAEAYFKDKTARNEWGFDERAE